MSVASTHLPERGRRSERNVSLDNIARIARGLKVKAWTLLDHSAK